MTCLALLIVGVFALAAIVMFPVIVPLTLMLAAFFWAIGRLYRALED